VRKRPHRQAKCTRKPKVGQLEDLTVPMRIDASPGVLRNKEVLWLQVAVEYAVTMAEP
jgi:hypothetical protein